VSDSIDRAARRYASGLNFSPRTSRRSAISWNAAAAAALLFIRIPENVALEKTLGRSGERPYRLRPCPSSDGGPVRVDAGAGLS
jgi:hypothetical protein